MSVIYYHDSFITLGEIPAYCFNILMTNLIFMLLLLHTKYIITSHLYNYKKHRDKYLCVFYKQGNNKGITQSKLAELLSVTPEYVSRIEIASTHPNLPMLAKISEQLEVTLSFLLEGTSKAGSDYKLNEFSVLLEKMSPIKRKLLYDIAEILLKEDF
jgi:transcriptional regulator with XRE-family HTH domain